MSGLVLRAARLLPLALAGLLLSLTATGQEAKPGLGETTFNRICVACHTTFTSRASPTSDKPVDPNIARAPAREFLRNMSPETILAALTSGKMQPQGSLLNDAERHAVAEFAAGKHFGALTYGVPGSEKPNLCTKATPVAELKDAPAWNGWAPDLTNARFQGLAAGGLTAADLPKLKLKWAFGYINTEQLKSQPAVFAQRVFTVSGAGDLYALDMHTGCTYWHYKAPGSLSTAPVVGPYQAGGRSGYAVYVAGQNATVYAVDADSGALIWQVRVDEHKVSGITGSPVLYAGRLYVPVQGVGEESAGPNYPCCTFRGSVSALDASTGAVIWKTYTVGESKPRVKAAGGMQLYGPSGGGIWSTPTIDVKRGLLYVGTGNAYSDPPQPGTDAIVAMDLATGAVRWTKQALKGDQWAIGCAPTNPDNPFCPEVLGPDYDFSGPPALVHLEGGRDLLVAPQKSGLIFAFDPDSDGTIVWQQRYGKGSGLGGQWGAAAEGQRVFIGTADMLSPPPGGMHAYAAPDGKLLWQQPPQARLCLKTPGQSCSAAQGGALTAIPGAVLNAGLDGGVRAYSTATGKVTWVFDANRDFKTVNGVTARGGAMDHGGPVVAGGMLFINSGYGGFVGHPGNVLVALGLN